MRNFFVPIAWIIYLTGVSFIKAEENPIRYQVNANYKDSLSLDVSFTYRSNAAGELILKYENDSWGDKDIFNCIAKFDVYPKPKHISFLRDSSLIKIETLPNQLSQINYSIKQDFVEPVKNYHRYRPIIQKEYFHILGMRLFILPNAIFPTDSDKATIEIIWNEPKSGTIFHSSFGNDTKQHIKVTREMLYASFFVGGDFRRYSWESGGQKVYFITRGTQGYISDNDIFTILKETISSQIDFWKDPFTTSFSVTLVPTYEEWTEKSKANSVGGSGLTNSFISFASSNPGTTLQNLKWLYNHELLHRWIGLTIINKNEEKEYWFSEGFTDYYAYKLMLKNNQLSLPEYIDRVNSQVMRPHYKSQIKEIPNADITQDKYWSDYSYQKLPYRRGFLYAFLIDLQTKQKYKGKKSLDNMMLGFLEMAKKSSTFRFNEEVFKNLISSYLGSDAISSFEKYIIQGKLIDFHGELPKGLSLQIQNELPNLKIDDDTDATKLSEYLIK